MSSVIEIIESSIELESQNSDCLALNSNKWTEFILADVIFNFGDSKISLPGIYIDALYGALLEAFVRFSCGRSYSYIAILDGPIIEIYFTEHSVEIKNSIDSDINRITILQYCDAIME
jgi:hypothetical protein